MSYPHSEVVQPSKADQAGLCIAAATAVKSETTCEVNNACATTHAIWPRLADAELLTGEHRADARSQQDKSSQEELNVLIL